MASIVVADDMITVLHNLTFILENFDHKVSGKATNCSEAIQAYREQKPDILILDILGMDSYYEEENKEINSFDVIRIILDEDKDAKIIILTATPKEEYIKKALYLGAKGFLVKGVSNDKIIDTINDVLRK
jgi:two-component system chemotaxis response regulator CheY